MPGLNLLPWREQQRNVQIRRFQVLLLGVVIVAGLITWLTDYLGRQVQHRRILEDTSIRQAIERFDAQLAQLTQHKEEQRQVQYRLQQLDDLQRRRWLLVDLLEQLERAVPPGVYLTTVTRQEARLHIHGLARSGSQVAQLLRNLSGALGEVDMQQMKAVDEGQAFELSVALRGEH
ncbi:PilN domain-containing protein [Pseudomonas tussilaginis]|uniref:PilN domain-containing protein n=1 Tax=unclassified Pseudomonas TaxID=196821 RepID=UPI000C6EB1CD|nr:MULTISPECIES: PilN domain-containing protein [unclassified Pseudomonas]QYX46153.1 PilN domain-containing protein [Pseudomonas sp. S11A 273]